MRSEKVFGGDVFNIAHGQTTALRDIKTLIEQKTGKRLDMEQRPPRVGDVSRTWADISKAKEMLGYAPEVSFEDGLARTVALFEIRKGGI